MLCMEFQVEYWAYRFDHLLQYQLTKIDQLESQENVNQRDWKERNLKTEKFQFPDFKISSVL